MKIAVDFYKENNLPQMNFNNEIQINNLINYLFNPNIEFKNETDMFKYITHDKRRKRIKFIYNYRSSKFDFPRWLIDIPIFFTKKELYSIAERHKNFTLTKFILIHKNKILNNDGSSFDEISNGDIIWIIECVLYPDNSYYLSLQNKFSGTQLINILVTFNGGGEIANFTLSGEVMVQELIRAIVERKGYSLEDCKFLFNGRELVPRDKRKLKDFMSPGIRQIECILLYDLLGFSPFGKTIEAINKNASVKIGTLNSISSPFNQAGLYKGKIIIGKVELKFESENYLAFYGINKDFNYIWKEEEN